MSRIGRVILVLACVSIAWAAQERTDTTQDQQQAIEKAILDVHEQMQVAAANLDADALYAHVLDEAAGPIVEGGFVAWTRQQAMDRTRAGFTGVKGITYSYKQRHITVLSPTTALWVADGNATAILADGREITGPFAETIVFAQRDGQWKVLHAHRSAPNRR